MTDEERNTINRLSDLVSEAQEALKTIVDHSVCLVT
jgi:hypothetical protein